MKKLPKEKRNQVILVWLVVVGLVAAWIFVVFQRQLEAKHRTGQALVKQTEQFKSMTNTLAMERKIKEERDAAASKLEELEYKMADRDDVFSWAVNTIRDFKANRDVEIPQISQPSITKNTLLPNFPYDQATLIVAGTAYYHDLGMFIADFENEFPFARISNIDIQPAANGNEKLNFKMDIIFLVKPEQSAARS